MVPGDCGFIGYGRVGVVCYILCRLGVISIQRTLAAAMLQAHATVGVEHQLCAKQSARSLCDGYTECRYAEVSCGCMYRDYMKACCAWLN
jgi:hypothetical protein